MRTIQIILSVLALLACSTSQFSTAAERHFTLENTYYHELPSKQTGKTHEIIVSLPPGYLASPKKQYPVLYYLDAYWDTPLLNAIYGNLIYDNLIPQIIMVGLSYPGAETDYGKERRQDFTPTDEGEQDGNSGNAAALLSFVKTDVVPLVENEYRIDSNQRALGGVSLGGLFSLYAMYQDPEFFGRHIAISPAAGWDNNYLAQLDARYAQKHKTLNARVFLSLGTDEYEPFRKPIEVFQKQLAQRQYKGMDLQNFQMEGLRHTGVKGDGYTRGLMWVWKDIAPMGPSGLEQAYR